ncbi:MAG: nuclear transport factor 2 family protein [Flavobacteriaceae bacterium]|nr:nuclear transport factor 2 family protein [Flavobacteriaceae bacterium]
MKNLLIIGLLLVVFTSCKQQEQRYFADSAEIETLKAGIDAYEAGDWDTWRSHFADTAKIYVNSKDPMSLSDRVKQLQQMTSAFSSYGFDKEDAYVEMVLDKEKETWVYYWAQHSGTMAANKRELSIPVHLAIQFVDGKIVEEHVYFDGTEMNKAMEELAASMTQEKEAE